MNVLHLSDTTLSGSPIRISNLLNKYSPNTKSRHIVWMEKLGYRTFEIDLLGPVMSVDELAYWVYEWADVIHYHNRYERQKIFQVLTDGPPRKPSVIQIHSPRREDESFEAEARSGVPLAIIGQYHPREWPELSFIVPNVVDIWDENYMGRQEPFPDRPLVTFAPSNSNMKKWNNKGMRETNPILRDMRLAGRIHYHLIAQQTHAMTMAIKRASHIGVDEIVTGSYHLSSLEYLSLGALCFANIDAKCEAVVKDMTGAASLPWAIAKPSTFSRVLSDILRRKTWIEMGKESRRWMETYWAPQRLVESYEAMYENLSWTRS